MQAASERRDPYETRVPLSEVLIDLSPSGYDESFSADGINLGIGGLSMRSAILPDIGSQLRCRFQSPHDGTRVNADCEVVWSSDSGPNVGEFGLRFTGMTDDDQDSIGRMVEAWEEELAGGSEGDVVRLQLDGVGSPIEATAIHRASDALLVEQPLPFLTIGTGVTEGGRRGVLQGVDLRLDDDVPRLVLTIWYQDANEEDSIDVPAVAFESAGGDTLMDAQAPRAARAVREEAAVEEPVIGHAVDEEPEARADQAVSVIAVPHRSVDSLADASVDMDDEQEEDAEAQELRARLRPDPRAALARVGRLARPAWTRVRGFLAVAWVRVGPAISRGARRLRAFVAGLVARIAPRFKALRTKALAKGTKRTTRPAKRRQTRPPATKTPGAPAQTSAAPHAPRKIGRWVLLGAVVLGLGAVVARAASSDEPIALLVKDEPEPVYEPAENPELGDETFAAVPEVAAPTPGEVPSDSPYADLGEAEPSHANEESTSEFGAASVEGGREFTLRLSLAPTGLVGEATEDGFRVRVLGANALDGARRIAGSHPRVAGASILNHGEEAELRIRFAPGEAPPYRVETRSAALLVTIGG